MKKLILFDMEGVIFGPSNFWMELHKAYGTFEEGLKLTKEYVKTDYEKLVKEVIGRLWKNKPADVYFKMVNESKYVPGVVETLKVLKSKSKKNQNCLKKKLMIFFLERDKLSADSRI